MKMNLIGVPIAGILLSVSAAFAEPSPRIRAVQLDLARQKESVEFCCNFISRSADAGYNTVVLYLEDRVKTASYPYLSDEESYSPEEIRRIIESAAAKSVDLVPVVSPLGHTERFLRHPGLRRFAEARSGVGRFGPREHFDVFCLNDPEARAWMERYITEVASLFPGRNLHLGFDETFDLGFCDRCRPEMERDGLGRLFLKHVLWAHGLSGRLGKRMWMWDDFFAFFPEVLSEVPRDILMCTWNYDGSLERTGPRNNFGGRCRRDILAEYGRLGFDAVVCPYHRIGNFRGLADYAASRRTVGFLVTMWEMTSEFHGWYFPRVLAAKALFDEPDAVVGDDWFSGGVKAAFKTEDEAFLHAAELLLADPALRAVSPSLPSSFREDDFRLSIVSWKTALDVLRGAASRPGTSAEIPADPLSPEGLLEDLVVRAEMAVLSREANSLARRLLFPDRTAAETIAAKKKLEAMAEPWRKLCARQQRQWRIWRGGTLSEVMKSLHSSYPAFLEKVRRIADAPAEDEWMLEVDILMADGHGLPSWRVEGLFSGGWRELAGGRWKGRIGAPAYSPVLVPLRLKETPERIRISQKGYGAGEICHISLWNARARLSPSAVVAVAGEVRDPHHLLTDDYRVASFGERDCTAAVLKPALSEKISSVKLEMSGTVK